MYDKTHLKNKVFLAIVVFAILLIPGTAQETDSVGMKNPAFVYCTELGYEYKTVQTDQGEKGICVIPETGEEFDAWDFLNGKVGQEYSYCALQGYGIETVSNGESSFSCEYAICVPTQVSTSSEISSASSSNEGIPVIELMNLNEKIYVKISDPEQPELKSSVTQDISRELSVKSDIGSEPPTSFDWSNKDNENWVTPVKNQGSCGSCWAFAATAGVEAVINIEKNDFEFDLDLSEQYLVSDCCSYCGSCAGGWTNNALQYIRDEGITDEACFPYTASNSSCSNRCSTWNENLWTIEATGQVPNNEIKEYLIEKGPLPTYISIHQGGYYDENDIYRGSNLPVNHGVLLVGYNDAGGYWIAKNSWGVGWQDSGYFKIGYGECSINGGSSPFYVEFDLTPPNAEITLPPGGTHVRGIQYISVTATDSLTGIDQVLLNVYNSSWSESYSTKPDMNGQYNYNLDTTLLADGSYELSVNTTDHAGNNNYTIFATIETENTAPVVTSANANPSSIEASGNNNTVLTVTATDSSGISSVTIDLSPIEGSTHQQMINNSGTWQFTVNATIIGTFELPINVTDTIGNSNTSTNISLEVIKIIPPSVIDTYPHDMTFGVDVNSTITASFSEVIESLTISSNTFKLYALLDEEIAGETFEDASGLWNSSNFQGFKLGEELAVGQSPIDDTNRTIEKGNLTYSTQALLRDYQVCSKEGIEVEGSEAYNVVSWLGKEYVVINDSIANWMLSKLIFEQNSTDTKRLHIDEVWDLGDGYSVTVPQTDEDNNEAWLVFSNSTGVVEDEICENQTEYVFSDEEPIFVTYLNEVNDSYVDFKYTWLTSQDTVTIQDAQIDNFTITVSEDRIDIENNDSITLTRNSTIPLLYGLEFEVDNTTAVNYTLIGQHQAEVFVDGDVSYDDTTRTAYFNPKSSLIHEVDYTAHITTGVKDEDGNGMIENYVWNFQTEVYIAPTPDPTPTPTPTPHRPLHLSRAAEDQVVALAAEAEHPGKTSII